MVHKYLSVLLLCSVPLIGMDRKLDEDIATDFRDRERKWNEDVAAFYRNHVMNRLDEMEKEIERRNVPGLSSEKEIETGRLKLEYIRLSEQCESALKRAKEEQPAPSQVSPCLDTFESYLKQPDTTLASNAVRDCIRKLVRFCRSNK